VNALQLEATRLRASSCPL